MLSLSSFAQAPVKGDVNEDGKVDEDDISAIIEIIKNGQNQPTYYWYVGTEKLTTDAEIEANANSIQISKSSDIPNSFTINEPTDEYFVYLYYPKAFGTATLTSSGLPLGGRDVAELPTQGFNLTQYNGWRIPKGNHGLIVNITF